LTVAGVWLLWRQKGWHAQSMEAMGVEEPRVEEPGVAEPPSVGRSATPSYGRELAIFVAAITGVCLIFYLLRPIEDRNYGGVSAAFRWMFWFAPLWLVTMLPAVDRM